MDIAAKTVSVKKRARSDFNDGFRGLIRRSVNSEHACEFTAIYSDPDEPPERLHLTFDSSKNPNAIRPSRVNTATVSKVTVGLTQIDAGFHFGKREVLYPHL